MWFATKSEARSKGAVKMLQDFPVRPGEQDCGLCTASDEHWWPMARLVPRGHTGSWLVPRGHTGFLLARQRRFVRAHRLVGLRCTHGVRMRIAARRPNAALSELLRYALHISVTELRGKVRHGFASR